MSLVSSQVSQTDEPTGVGAVDAARTALIEEVGSADVGAHLGHVVEGPAGDDAVVTHLFACERAGYVGWHWSVTLVQLPGETPTIDELVLIPGDRAIVAPAWVPYRDRIQPGDLSPGDLLPVADDDPRLVPTYAFGDDPLDADAKAQVRQVAQELGLGRVRTLSIEGLDGAAQRWYAGQAGPAAPVAQSAPHHCYSCGFLVRISGSLGASFGVCANGDANDDGRVVSMDHGCGAHSEVRLAKKHEPKPLPEPVVDELTLDLLETF
ncbi:DUF3027 domain-containing protein [Nocardioides sp. CER19]|uniref:DUF3027 domain-containing protein n=1 Tax=Nocardioides sp. CER19 TaxID=3038538 RepID=UPI00244BAEE4|nr:DUF3027 domain-containing protein [Nocardioides sp. CER19]MDH2413483.1 DUF3027 domain-containing protein [Nocardioides sp. CER19]